MTSYRTIWTSCGFCWGAAHTAAIKARTTNWKEKFSVNPVSQFTFHFTIFDVTGLTNFIFFVFWRLPSSENTRCVGWLRIQTVLLYTNVSISSNTALQHAAGPVGCFDCRVAYSTRCSIWCGTSVNVACRHVCYMLLIDVFLVASCVFVNI